jgi:hypothetical protein
MEDKTLWNCRTLGGNQDLCSFWMQWIYGLLGCLDVLEAKQKVVEIFSWHIVIVNVVANERIFFRTKKICEICLQCLCLIDVWSGIVRISLTRFTHTTIKSEKARFPRTTNERY